MWLRPYLEDVTLLAKAIVFALVVLIAVAVEGSSAQPTPTWWFLVNLGTFVIWKYRQGDLDAMSVETLLASSRDQIADLRSAGKALLW